MSRGGSCTGGRPSAPLGRRGPSAPPPVPLLAHPCGKRRPSDRAGVAGAQGEALHHDGAGHLPGLHPEARAGGAWEGRGFLSKGEHGGRASPGGPNHGQSHGRGPHVSDDDPSRVRSGCGHPLCIPTSHREVQPRGQGRRRCASATYPAAPSGWGWRRSWPPRRHRQGPRVASRPQWQASAGLLNTDRPFPPLPLPARIQKRGGEPRLGWARPHPRHHPRMTHGFPVMPEGPGTLRPPAQPSRPHRHRTQHVSRGTVILPISKRRDGEFNKYLLSNWVFRAILVHRDLRQLLLCEGQETAKRADETCVRAEMTTRPVLLSHPRAEDTMTHTF